MRRACRLRDRVGQLTVTGENDSLHVTLQQAARHSVRIASVKADDGSTLSGADITVTHAEGGEQTAVNGVYSLQTAPIPMPSCWTAI